MFKSLDKPYLIAEISANHNGKLSAAKKLIHLAKTQGADAVKIQTYTPDSMTLRSKKNFFKIKSGIWKGYTLWDLYNQAQTPLEWHKELFSYAKKLKIKIFSTPFDELAVDFLEELNCPIYKISSFEMTDLPLIKKISRTKKPIIISTGMANLEEIEECFNTAKANGAKDITLLYCVSNYPSNKKDFNLNNISVLKNKFKCRVGLSDHSLDTSIAQAAVAVGAEVFEKHIAYSGQKKGLDLKFSLKGREIKKYRDAIDDTYKLLGKKYFFRNKTENINKKYRRSIFAVKDINKGDLFSYENLRRVRPAYGIEPKYFEKIIGRKSPISISKNTPLKKQILIKLNIV